MQPAVPVEVSVGSAAIRLVSFEGQTAGERMLAELPEEEVSAGDDETSAGRSVVRSPDDDSSKDAGPAGGRDGLTGILRAGGCRGGHQGDCPIARPIARPIAHPGHPGHHGHHGHHGHPGCRLISSPGASADRTGCPVGSHAGCRRGNPDDYRDAPAGGVS